MNDKKQQDNQSFNDLWHGFTGLLTRILSLKEADDTDVQGTIEGIKKDIEFRGPTVWILILSIFIASIGLNQNSTAVVIGAMLISPLMGPILGIGLSLGTNDIKTLFRALKNFGVMIVVALLTSTIYFAVTPIVDVQQEILNRTQPNMLDAVIAFVGGLAGIIAGSRKEKTNVIPGVAIATALMPPLCTAGFGIASGNYQYFFGAFYLFLLNSVFICLATVFIVKYLHFPLASFINKQREKRVRVYIFFFTFLLVAPSVYFFYGVSKKSITKQKVEHFIKREFEFPNTSIIKQEFSFLDSLTRVDLFCIGEHVSPNNITILNNKLKKYDLDNIKLQLHQSSKEDKDLEEIIKSHVNVKEVNDMHIQQIKVSEEKNKQIDSLKAYIAVYENEKNRFVEISKEVKDLFTEVNKFGYAQTIETTFEKDKQKVIPTFLIQWKNNQSSQQDSLHGLEEQKMKRWLKNKLSVDTLQFIHY